MQSLFHPGEALALLERTPPVLSVWLRDLPEPWLHADEGPDTWSPYLVVGHLIHGEKTDWVARAEQILSGGADRPFEPFDRFAMLGETRPIGDLLEEFAQRREENLERYRSWDLSEESLSRPGLHPELGPVTLRQLLATWVVHDEGHLAQIARVLSRRYAAEVGPWTEYLPVLTR